MFTELTQCLGLKKEVSVCKNKPGLKKFYLKAEKTKTMVKTWLKYQNYAIWFSNKIRM